MLLVTVYGSQLVRLEPIGRQVIHIVFPKHDAQLLRKTLEEEEDN
jgi:hypothetical protein